MDRRAFTLIELVMVLVIIGLLAAMIIPKFESYRKDAAFATTYQNWKILKNAILAYHANEGHWPASGLQGLIESPSGKKYLSKIPFEMLSQPPSDQVVQRPNYEGGWTYVKEASVTLPVLGLNLTVRERDDFKKKFSYGAEGGFWYIE